MRWARRNPENLRIKYTTGKLHCFTKIPRTMTPGAIKFRRFKEAIRSLIDCRVCCQCKFAFISKGGHNNCSECFRAAYAAYKAYHLFPEHYKVSANMFRPWAVERGLLTARVTRKPYIPVPDLERIKPQIARTMDLMQKSIELDTWVVDSMPRVLGARPYPHLVPMKLSNGRAK